METVVTAPAAPAAEPVKPALTPEGTAPGAVVDQPAEKTFTQKELDDILEKRLGKERRKREDLSRRLQVTEELALRSRPQEQPKPQADEGAPKRESYHDYESFLEAKAEWRADQAVEKRFKERTEKEATERTQAERGKIEKTFRERSQKAATEVEDFEDVLSASEAPMTPQMAEAIMHSELGPKLAYHLAKNPEEAERIAALPAARQATEIGRLETKIESAPPPKKPSNAPAPIAPVGGKDIKADAEPDPKDQKAWIDWRNRSELKKRRG